MATIRLSDPTKTEAVVKRMFTLAYAACGGTAGMGIFQERKSVSEDEIWRNVYTMGVYPGTASRTKEDTASGDAYGDYVFGRMMKLRVQFDKRAGTITIPDYAPQADYQGWSSGKPKVASDVPYSLTNKYPSYLALLEHAINDIGTSRAT